LVWPSDLAIGDKRRAPPVTLLDPLYQHWGLALDGPVPEGAPVAAGMIEGQPVALAAPGQWRFGEVARNCRIEPGNLVADCHFGSGEAILVADADMLDARLWAEKSTDGAIPVRALVARLARSGGVT
jgi:hypothetical protein